MHRPSPEESAAIAAAYAILRLRRERTPRRAEASRWRLAAHFPELDTTQARIVARASSRWSASARLDD